MEEQQHDIAHDRKLVEEEMEMVESLGIRMHPEKRSLSVGMILIVLAIAMTMFISITYLPALFQ